MSLNLIFPTPSHVAESYKNIQVNDAIIDGNLTVNGAIIQPNSQQIIISSDFANSTITFASNSIPGSELAFSNYSSILPQGITYDTDNIVLSQSGIYQINIQFVLLIPVFTVNTLFDLIFWDDTEFLNIAESQVNVFTNDPFTISINRVAFLEAGKNYQILIKQTTAQNVSVVGSSLRSFMNIVKLF